MIRQSSFVIISTSVWTFKLSVDVTRLHSSLNNQLCNHVNLILRCKGKLRWHYIYRGWWVPDKSFLLISSNFVHFYKRYFQFHHKSDEMKIQAKEKCVSEKIPVDQPDSIPKNFTEKSLEKMGKVCLSKSQLTSRIQFPSRQSQKYFQTEQTNHLPISIKFKFCWKCMNLKPPNCIY